MNKHKKLITYSVAGFTVGLALLILLQKSILAFFVSILGASIEWIINCVTALDFVF